MIYISINLTTTPKLDIHPKIGPAATHDGNGAKLLAYRSDIILFSILFCFLFLSVLVGVSALVVQNELIAQNVRPARAHDTKRKAVHLASSKLISPCLTTP